MSGGSIYGLYEPGGELRYIGQTVQPLKRRLIAHVSPPQLKRVCHRTNWIKSLLALGQKPEIRELQVFTEQADLDAAETYWIQLLKDKGVRLVNSNLGGRGGWDPSPEVRAKMSAAHKGRPSPRKGLKGPIQSDETKARRSESMKKAWAQPSEKVLIGRLKLVGQKRSEAFREKMRTIALHREAQKRNNNLLKQENQNGLR